LNAPRGLGFCGKCCFKFLAGGFPHGWLNILASPHRMPIRQWSIGINKLEVLRFDVQFGLPKHLFYLLLEVFVKKLGAEYTVN
jgi:hypothetical protein